MAYRRGGAGFETRVTGQHLLVPSAALMLRAAPAQNGSRAFSVSKAQNSVCAGGGRRGLEARCKRARLPHAEMGSGGGRRGVCVQRALTEERPSAGENQSRLPEKPRPNFQRPLQASMCRWSQRWSGNRTWKGVRSLAERGGGEGRRGRARETTLGSRWSASPGSERKAGGLEDEMSGALRWVGKEGGAPGRRGR